MIFRSRSLKLVQFFKCQIDRIIVFFELRFFSIDKKIYDVAKSPFFFDNKSRVSMLAGDVAKSIKKNALFPAGRKFSFNTDSKLLSVKIIYGKIAILSNMSIEFASATDIRIKSKRGNLYYTVCTDSPCKVIAERDIWIPGNGECQVDIYLPSYAYISKMYIGIEKSAKINIIKDKKKPLVFYGSSITQGCCASSPLKSYSRTVANYFGYPLLNFGFSESAKGEKNLINYIASFEASLFIIEYDHNADYELLSATHYRVYEIIRKTNTYTPIIFLSRFSGGLSITATEEEKRISVIKQTVVKARETGDRNVYFIPGKNVIVNKSAYFVDDRHPNDKGMKVIADLIIGFIEENNIIL